MIAGDTVIQTDPSITTNGVTDFGKIYRGTADDGLPSTYLFGATSDFDGSSGFDEVFGDPANAPMAVFKFAALRLAGDPTIVIPPGGATRLGLISVGDLDSGSAPATLTFAGLDSLLLATQDGSITLGSNLTFENIPTLFIYARGTDSTLTFDSTVSGTEELTLLSQGDLVFNRAFQLLAEGSPGNASLQAGGSIFAPAVMADTLKAGGDITVDNSAGLYDFGLVANTITAGGVLNLINTPTISPNDATSDGTIGFTPVDFTLTATDLIGTGPTLPLLFSNGSDAEASFGNDNPGNGGSLTLNITHGSLMLGPAGDLTGIAANGGFAAVDSTAGGNGGTVNIDAGGHIILEGGDITATTSSIPNGGPATLGDGGTVNLSAHGSITVSSKIEASSNDAAATPSTPVRRSAKGGNISLTSTKATAGAAITVTNTGQLLALLDKAAPGPGGKITILASGNGGSSVNVHGTAIADRGTVDIRHTGANGTVNLSTANGENFVTLRGDIVKAGALGDHGVLTVGRGVISANDTLQLYGASANGEVRFVDNVAIGGTNLTVIAADTVTILNGRVVTVTGARADVYTGFNKGVPNANYSGFGGNGSTTGTFAGEGANNPQPISNAPPFDRPPGG